MTQSNTTQTRIAFLFDLDGTLVDSVYQHVLAWREALESDGMKLAVWRIHRQIGMSGGLFVNALLRETGHTVSKEEAERLQQAHGEAFKRYASQVRPLPGAEELLSYLTEKECRGRSRPVGDLESAVSRLTCSGLSDGRSDYHSRSRATCETRSGSVSRGS